MMYRRCIRSVRALAALALGLFAAACGNLTAGGFGEAVVVVAADDATAPAIQMPGFRDGPQTSDHDDDEPEGELEVELLVSLVGSDGSITPLSDDVIEVQVDLEGIEQDETLPRSLPAAQYTELRLVFLKIEAEVDAGLVINGVPFTGPVDVDLEADSLVVTRPLSLELPDEGRAEIFVDLNAAQWLQALDPSTSIVDGNVFADLIEVRVR